MSQPSSNTAFRRLSRFTRDSPFFASLRTRLLVLVLLAILPALGLIIYNALDQANHTTLGAVRTASNRHDDLTESTRQLLATLTQLSEVREQSAERCRSIFTHLLALHHVYTEVGASDRDGNVFASATHGAHPANIADRDFFQAAIRTGRFTSGDYHITPDTRLAVITFASPVRLANDEPNGIVYATLHLDWLKAMLNGFDLPPNSSMTVFDSRRLTLLRHPNDSFVGENLPNSGSTNRAVRPAEPGGSSSSGLASPPRQDRGHGTTILKSRDGTWRLYGYNRLGQSPHTPGAMISIGIPLGQMLGWDMIFLGLVSALALGAAWFGGNFIIVRRIKDLVRAAIQVSAGQLGARTSIAYGRGELGQLARAFDEMSESIRFNSAERERAARELAQLNEELEQRVTERTLELKRSNEDLEQFASVASHDLQEPLRMVTNYLQLLQHRYAGQLDSKANEFIGFATDGSSRMQQLIRDLLAYSRIATQQAPSRITPCEELLEQALSNLKLAVEETRATITHDPLPSVEGDPALLAQLFQNLISNALKFHGEAPPKIHIGATRAGPCWQFSVRDNGIGMKHSDLERIFIIFQRLHSRDAYPGTGIGLSLCKKIVERHGGRIWVESEPGKGACFFFTLPALDRT